MPDLTFLLSASRLKRDDILGPLAFHLRWARFNSVYGMGGERLAKVLGKQIRP